MFWRLRAHHTPPRTTQYEQCEKKIESEKNQKSYQLIIHITLTGKIYLSQMLTKMWCTEFQQEKKKTN